MNNDLISREALKKAIQNLEKEPNYQHEGETWQNGLCSAEILIDDAPTVPLPDFKEGYKQAIRDGKTNFSRPTGEWIDTGDMEEYWAEEYQCSICGAKDHWHNFCPNCGARMKDAENE